MEKNQINFSPPALSVLSGILLVASWPPLPTAFMLFLALVPLLMLQAKLEGKNRSILKFWLWSCLSMFIFNLGTTWWVWNASPSGCIMMLSANTLIMSTPLMMYALTRLVLPKIAPFAFICFWIGMEYFHFNWNAPWPWLTLGKGFAGIPFFIQWYEYTGEAGGTFLILLINLMIYNSIKNRSFSSLWKPSVLIAAMTGISFLCSFRYLEIQKGLKQIECVISQPNIDPYEEKFSDGDNYIEPEIQLEKAILPSLPHISRNTDILLLPETAITGWNNENKLDQLSIMEPLLKLTDSNTLSVIAGAESFAVYESEERPTMTARYDSFSAAWYDHFNTAFHIMDGHTNNIYHKSKLVAGVEKMPFAFLEKLSINLGGTSGSLGTSNLPVNFKLHDGTPVAPLICYESIFGDYTNEFVRNGAQLLAVITNDGWWGETPGYSQHLLYGTIRCIETRREMIRSANTGVSAVVNRFGRITFSTKYREQTAFKCYVNPYDNLTFYVRHGNLIGISASILAIILGLSSIVRFVVTQKKNPGINN